MKKKILLFTSLFLLGTQAVFASTVTGKIISLQTQDNGKIVVRIAEASDCPSRTYKIMQSVNGTARILMMNSLTAGLLTGKDVILDFDESSSNCDIKRAILE